mmetsp:Transcript_23252/g.40008  ORF Transcript_23252/g.40008 Transcript_23252/m.40008 type:complete len:205 (+) Transcript_23252:58-672(+)
MAGRWHFRAALISATAGPGRPKSRRLLLRIPDPHNTRTCRAFPGLLDVRRDLHPPTHHIWNAVPEVMWAGRRVLEGCAILNSIALSGTPCRCRRGIGTSRWAVWVSTTRPCWTCRRRLPATPCCASPSLTATSPPTTTRCCSALTSSFPPKAPLRRSSIAYPARLSRSPDTGRAASVSAILNAATKSDASLATTRIINRASTNG